MIIDGKKLAEELKDELKKDVSGFDSPLLNLRRKSKKLRLAVIYIGENPASESFIKIKKAFGSAIGVDLEIKKPAESIWKSREKLRKWISQITHDKKNTGVIVQLPIPDEIKGRTKYILDSIPAAKDVDVLSSEAVGKFANGRLPITPPVVDAIQYIFEKHGVKFEDKNIVVVGAGDLVGKPIASWLLSKKLPFTIITSKSRDFSETISKADIVISGAGKAGMIKKNMIKDGAVAIDAGTSGEQGQIKGDFEPNVSEKASLFTPVPGGVGPLTVAMLFKNLITLAKK